MQVRELFLNAVACALAAARGWLRDHHSINGVQSEIGESDETGEPSRNARLLLEGEFSGDWTGTQ